jgi:NitT/TauT family transport system substrate-binding protein
MMTKTRRQFLTTLSLAGAAGFVRAPSSLAEDGALETTTVRLSKFPAICFAPQYVADELLRSEGFSDIRYVDQPPGATIATGEVDFSLSFAPQLAAAVDAGQAVTALAGVHLGCFKLFGNEGIHSITDLRGKSVGSLDPVLAKAMVAYVGLDPVKDVRWVVKGSDTSLKEMFTEGKIDAYLALPPAAQELRRRQIGHVVIDSVVDRPWSEYFCCLLAGNREFVRKHPVATKRALRAVMKASDFCAADPARVARQLVDRGFTTQYDYAFQALSEIAYDKWREYDPEDSVRFYALRLREGGLIKSSPQKIIADGTDWRFIDELKRELKA